MNRKIRNVADGLASLRRRQDGNQLAETLANNPFLNHGRLNNGRALILFASLRQIRRRRDIVLPQMISWNSVDAAPVGSNVSIPPAAER